jgi:WD40 repeat protein
MTATQRVSALALVAVVVALGPATVAGPVPDARPVAPATFVRAPAKDVPPRFDAVGAPIPQGAVARLGTLRLRHAQKLTTVVALPDGKTVASGSADGTIRFWDAATGKELHRFPGDRLALSPDGKSWASWDSSGKDTNKGKESKIRLRDLATGKQLREFIRPQDTYVVAFSPDGRFLAAGGLNEENVNQVTFWDVATGKELPAPQLGGKYDYVHHLGFSPDGKLLTTAGETDGSVRLWELATGKETKPFRTVAEGGRVTEALAPFAFAPDGKTVVSRGRVFDNTGSVGPTAVYQWDVATGKELRRFESPDIGGCAAFTFSTTGETLVSGHGAVICVWDAGTGKLLLTLRGHADDVTCLSVSRDGKTLVSGSQDHTLRLWDLATGKSLLPDTGHTAPILSVGLSPDNKTAITAGGDVVTGADRTIRLWDLATGKETRRLGESAPIRSVALAPNGRLLATGSRGESDRGTKASLWDLATGKQLHQFSDHFPDTSGRVAFAFSPDSKTLAVGTGRSVILFDTVTGKSSARADTAKEQRAGEVTAIAFSPDGKAFAWVGSCTCRVSETATGKELHYFTIRDRPDSLHSITWAAFPDDRTLLLGINGAFCRWDLATGSERDRFPVEWGRAFVAALSRDGKTLATGAADGTIRLWDVGTGKERHTLRGHQRNVGDESYAGVTALAWSVDGTLLVSGGADTTVLVWDVSALK